MLLDLIAGARPNFVKLAPIIRAIEGAKAGGQNISYRFIHTGQHSSEEMSAAMLRDLGMPSPHIELGCSGKTRGEMLASVIKKYELVLSNRKPAWTVVVGDVTSTLGAALAAKSADVSVAHVEAGLRSGDRSMPEEINRIATDAIADLHFTTSRTAGEHLMREGVSADRIRVVGNVMVDALLQTLPKIKKPDLFDQLGLVANHYCLLTLHRPVNVDDAGVLSQWLWSVKEANGDLPVIFPVHPRTAQTLSASGISLANIHIVEPLSYAAFLYLEQGARIIITDSGGVSEEATLLRKPCVTLRTTTERPETLTEGTNVLASAFSDIAPSIEQAYLKASIATPLPELWDGEASHRIVNALLTM